MTIDEKTRLDLRQWFENHMNERMANAMMEAMPPVAHTELATKSFVRDEITSLRTELKGDIASVHGEMAGLRGEMAGLQGEMASMQITMVRWMIATQLTTIGLLGAYTTAIT